MMEIHSSLFKNFLVSDYKWWHTNLRKWLTNNTNKDNQTAVIETLKSVCRVIAKEIVDKETDQGRQILEVRQFSFCFIFLFIYFFVGPRLGLAAELIENSESYQK